MNRAEGIRRKTFETFVSKDASSHCRNLNPFLALKPYMLDEFPYMKVKHLQGP